MKEYKVVTQKYGQKIDKKLAKISGSKIKHLDYTSYRWECANEKEKEEIHKKIEHSINGNILYGGGDDYTQYEIMYNLNKLEMYIKREDSINWKRYEIKF